MSEVRILNTASRASALVDDLVFVAPDGLDVEAYLVRPARAAGARLAGEVPGAGLVMWHWLDSEAPDGNRTQYLDEAADLASAGVV